MLTARVIIKRKENNISHKMKKVFIDTLGCAKNEYDSQIMAAALVDSGFELTDDALESDIMIVNTCGFIEDAKKESINRILELADEFGEKRQLVVTGCLSERYHDELVKEMPEVDMFFGVNDYDRLPALLEGLGSDTDTDKVGSGLDDLRYRRRDFEYVDNFGSPKVYGYLKIAEGCNNACSFCAIPLIRGPYRSKKIEDCVREAREMADAGIRELIVIAQDTSQYGRDLYGEVRLPQLLHELSAIEGIEWIRLMYVYDNGITDELIDAIASEPKVCNYIDMPIQHISDNVLRLMRRQSSGDSIKAVITKLRERIPDVHVRTTILVGTPGETEADFDELIDFIDSYDIDRLGAFAFSDEEGTLSHLMDDKVPEEVAEMRRDAVMEHQLAVSEKLNERKLGKVMEVIVDEVIETVEEINTYSGRSRYDAPEIDCAVTFTSVREDIVPGDVVKVLITDAYEYDLEGKEVTE